MDYTTIVELIGVLPGEHQIQFVAIKPNRSLEVLAEVPLTITGPFAGIRGHEISYKDTKVTFPDGDYDAEKEITEVTFSLVAVGEDRLEGQGHVSYIQNNESFNPQSRCPLTSSIASVEWDVFYEGTFTVLPDGSMSVYFEGTPERGPDYVFSQSAPGCEEKTFTQTLTGLSTPSFSPTLVDGEYYERQDREPGEGYTGEDFHEILVEFSSDE